MDMIQLCYFYNLINYSFLYYSNRFILFWKADICIAKEIKILVQYSFVWNVNLWN